MLNFLPRPTLVFALALVTIAGVGSAAARPAQDSVPARDLALLPFTAQAGNMVTVAGAGSAAPSFETFDAAGNLYFADYRANLVRKVDAATGVMTTVAGKPGPAGDSADNIAATSASLHQPCALAFDRKGNLYIAEYNSNRIRMVAAATGIITTVAGTGTAGFRGDGAAAAAADLHGPRGIAFDSQGSLYIADSGNNRIRKITPNSGDLASGKISTVAGAGAPTFNGDKIAATAANLNAPSGLAIDAEGNIYLSEFDGARVRMIARSTGLITTLAGNGMAGNTASTAGKTNLATTVDIGSPAQVAVDRAGNVYFADSLNAQVDKVEAANGYFSVVAGTGIRGFTGDGPAIYTQLNDPVGVAVDARGNLFIADSGNALIRMVAPGASTQAATPRFNSAAASNGTKTVEILDDSADAVIHYTLDGSLPTTRSAIYSQPILIDKTTTIRTIAEGAGLTRSSEARRLFTPETTTTVATPTFSPVGGVFHVQPAVTISDATAGAVIYYTTDGTAPTPTSAKYTAPITVSTSEAVKAIALASGHLSAVGGSQYVLTAATPTLSPAPGTYSSAQTVTITDSTPNVPIYYTTNGSNPVAGAAGTTRYAGPITVAATETVTAIAGGGGFQTSRPAPGLYTINTPPATPTFTYSAGRANGNPANGATVTLTTTASLTIKDAVPGTTIYYTANGATPTTASTAYSRPISVLSSQTIKAIAVNGAQSSAVATVTFVINLPQVPTPTFTPPAGASASAVHVGFRDSLQNPPTSLPVSFYYTTNGATPTTSSTLWDGSTPILVSATETIKVIATAANYGYSNSAVASATYTIQ